MTKSTWRARRGAVAIEERRAGSARGPRADHGRVSRARGETAGVLPGRNRAGERIARRIVARRRRRKDERRRRRRESHRPTPRLEVEDGPFGFRAFLAAASLVASRAFHVDDAHGQGLVPVADLFNHAGGEHVHFEGEGDEGDFRHSVRDDDADESLSESDDARVEAEMRRLAAEDDPSPSRARKKRSRSRRSRRSKSEATRS